MLTTDDSAYMDIFQDAYAAIQTHVRTSDGFIVCCISALLTPVPASDYAGVVASAEQCDRLTVVVLPRCASAKWRSGERNPRTLGVLEPLEAIRCDPRILGASQERNWLGRMAWSTRVYRIDILSTQGTLALSH